MAKIRVDDPKRDKYGRFAKIGRKLPPKKLPPVCKGRFIKQPSSYVRMERFDFEEHGLVCRLTEDKRLMCNMVLYLMRHSDPDRKSKLDSLLLDVALNVLDRFFPINEDQKPVKLKRGKASRDAVKLYRDFAEEFLLPPRWKKEMSMEQGQIVEYKRFDMSLKRIEDWTDQAAFLLSFKKLR